MNSKLEKLRAKTTKFELPDLDVTLDIKALTVDELAHLSDFSETKDNKGALNYLTYRTLRKSLPSTGDEGIDDDKLKEFIRDEMDSKIALELIQKVMEISDLPVEDLKASFQE